MFMIPVYFFLSFVLSTSSDRYFNFNYHFDLIFNEYVFIFCALLVLVYSLLVKKFRVDFIFIVFAFFLFLFNFFKYFSTGAFDYFYSSIFMLAAPFFRMFHFSIVLKYIKYVYFILTTYLFFKVISVFFGLSFLPFSDVRYQLVTSTGEFRLSNSLLFGQNNAAGAAILSLFLLYLIVIVRYAISPNLMIIGSHFLLCLATMSGTAFVFSAFASLVLIRFSLIRIVQYFFVILFFSFIFIDFGLYTKAESLFFKLNVFFDFVSNIGLRHIFFGYVGLGYRPYVESSILDLFIDFGFLPVLFFLFIFFYVFSKSIDFKLKFIFSIFLILSLISNSSLMPMVFLNILFSFYMIVNRGLRSDL